MNIAPVQTSFYNKQQKQPAFTGKSKLFEPVKKVLDQHAEAIANKYYVKFLSSDFAKWLADKTKNIDNMVTHMVVAGATLISGMYVVRTLKNDKLDKEKRKTLAINDGLTWGLSTAGTYFVDSRLANWWGRVTTRFAASYLQKHPESKNTGLLGEWDSAKIYEMMEKAPKLAVDKYKEMKGKLSPEELEKWFKEVKMEQKHFDKMEEYLGKGEHPGNALELNISCLKDKKLSSCISGMGILKSLLIGTMIYRYLVPVLVMKPANKIGAYIHKKNADKENQQKTQA